MAHQDEAIISKRTGRRIGYAIAVALNVAFLVIANNILDWGWLPWLTEDFSDVLPIMNASLIASIVANVAYLAYDARWFKGLTELGLLVIALIVTIRFWQVFPFDFSAYDFGWGTLVRWLLGLALFGVCVAILVQVIQLARLAVNAGREPRQPSP